VLSIDANSGGPLIVSQTYRDRRHAGTCSTGEELGHLLLLTVCCVLLVSCARESGPTPRPNVLLIVLDDFGYNDLGANGNRHTPTPALDRFSQQGARYTRHYAHSTCTPARVALLTGRSPAQSGFRPTHVRLSSDTPTIASVLHDNGYHTEHIGKWHVGNSSESDAPLHAGFEKWFGFLTQFDLQGNRGARGRGRPGEYINPWLRGDSGPSKRFSGHLTDILTDRATNFLENNPADSQPWFLNLWYLAPHQPIQPSKSFADSFPNSDEGKYHALIAQLDHNIGRVLRTLDEQGLSKDTLVIVLSDNGGTNRETENNSPFWGRKTTFFEGGVRTPLLIRWPGRTQANTVISEAASIYDIFPTIAHAAGAPVPDTLEGRDLFTDDGPPPRPLFWEHSNSEQHRYAVLSADRRWRFVPPILNDLEADFTGSTNVMDEHPDVAAELREEFLRWRLKTREVATKFRRDGDHTSGTLEGNDMLRSPGHGGFTFAIGITPGGSPSSSNQVVAEQNERWRLDYHPDHGLSLELLGLSARGPKLSEGQCHEVVVSSDHQFPLQRPRRARTILNLYVDGQLVDSARDDAPVPNLKGYANPTHIGRNAAGEQRFTGHLSRPFIVNERVVPDDQVEKVNNGVSGLPTLCSHTP
jgi:arylsulfatase A-like enzyme